jgi:hypothetical protein
LKPRLLETLVFPIGLTLSPCWSPLSFPLILSSIVSSVSASSATIRSLLFNKFTFTSKQASKILPEKQKNVETLSESFTSRGKGTPSISGDRKRTKPKRQKHLNTKMWSKPETANMAKSTTTETDWTA